MKCLKCNGCMTLDPTLDFYMTESRWRCINCGTRRVAMGAGAPFSGYRPGRTDQVQKKPAGSSAQTRTMNDSREGIRRCTRV
jgi:hypothetical protein